MEWGILGDETSWRQPRASWFEVWWKTRPVAVPYKGTALSRAIQKEEAEKELGQSLEKFATSERPALDAAFSSAPANCGRAEAVLSTASLLDTDSQDERLRGASGLSHELDMETSQKAPVRHLSRR